MQEKTLHKVDRPNKYTHFAELLHTRCVDKMVYLVLPYKPNIPLIHSILCYKLFANICKFLYLYNIILADIYA